MARRRLFLGVRIGPVIVGGSTGGRRRRRHQYQPGVHPMRQDNVRYMFREMHRRRAERVGS